LIESSRNYQPPIDGHKKNLSGTFDEHAFQDEIQERELQKVEQYKKAKN